MYDDDNKRIRQILKQLRGLASQKWLTKDELLEVRERILARGVDAVLLFLQERLERSIDGSFDPEISRKLDAIQVLLSGRGLVSEARNTRRGDRRLPGLEMIHQGGRVHDGVQNIGT